MHKLFLSFLAAAHLLTLSLFGASARVVVVVENAFVRNAIVSRLQMEGYSNIREEATAHNIDALFSEVKPDYVIVDVPPADLVVVQAAEEHAVKKTVLLASAELYPQTGPLPFKEELLEKRMPENSTKIAAFRQCKAYNGLKKPRYIFCPYPYLAGPHDTGFQLKAAHPLKNVAYRMLRAKWQKDDFAVVSNDGRAKYELMHVDDLASACVFLLTADTEDDIINIGYGSDTSIKTIAEYTKSYLKFTGAIVYDLASFDDIPRIVLDSSRLTTLGWYPTVTVQDTIKDTVLWLETKVQGVYNPLEETPFVLP